MNHPQSQYNGSKLKLIIGTGAIVTLTALSTTNPAVLAVGFCFGVFGMGSIASSMNRRGESIQAGSQELALKAVRAPILDAIAEVIADGKEGAELAIGRIIKPASDFATVTATQLGGISEAEYEARQLSDATQIIRHPEHLAQVIVGHGERLASTLLLAPPGSGKTTLLHYLTDYLITRSEKTITLVVDYDYGSSNNGVVSGWRGLPLWDADLRGRKDAQGNFYRPTDRSAIFTEPSEFLELIRSLRQLFDTRRNLRKSEEARRRAGETVTARKFPVIFLICDEFQNVFANLSDEEKTEVLDAMGTIMRSPKHRIAILYAIHDTKATGGIDLATLDKMTIALLGGAVTGVITAAKSFTHALPRFGEETKAALATRQKSLLATYPPELVDKMLAAIDLKTAITAADGTEFRAGNHVLDIADFRAFVARPQMPPTSPLVEATAPPMPDNVIDIKAASSAKTTRAEVLSVPVKVLTVGLEVGSSDWANYWGDKFMAWLTENVDQFEPKNYSLSGFRKISQSNGWGRDSKGDEYAFLQYLARQFQATSPRDDLAQGAIGYIDIPALIDAIGGAS
jgi:GTPase SAR1 family protein